MKNACKALLISSLLVWLLVPLAEPGEDGQAEKEAVRQHNRLCQGAFPDQETRSAPAQELQLKDLIDLSAHLLAAEISDPSILQKLDFISSYEALFALEQKESSVPRQLVSRWKELLVQLDVKAHKINNSMERPYAQWVLHKGLDMAPEPTPRMIDGFIERVEETVRVGSDGRECTESERGCHKLRYVQLKCLVPGIHDPTTAMERLHQFPPQKANPRVTNYWEVLLEPELMLMRRNYQLRPFPGYAGRMENYYQIAFRDDRRIVAIEQNARVGRFILWTDNAAVYIQSPPHGVIVSLIFSGKYAMERFFYVLVGDKLLQVPVEVMAILRQYILDPGLGVEHAVEAGRKDYRENQRIP